MVNDACKSLANVTRAKEEIPIYTIDENDRGQIEGGQFAPTRDAGTFELLNEKDAEISKLRTELANVKASGPGAIHCFECGGYNHIVRNCPVRQARGQGNQYNDFNGYHV